MKLYCPVCDTTYPLSCEHLTCPMGNKNSVHPLQKVFDKSDHKLSVETIAERWNAGENGFSIFRECLGSYAEACEKHSETSWIENLSSLERNASKIHADGFTPTPLVDVENLATNIGWQQSRLFVKNETATILGSHKARHAIASILQLQTRRRDFNAAKPSLAIFSCGNAALGAAAIAKAADFQLFTFVPSSLSRDVESLLSNMDAKVVKVRRDGAVGQGDPCNNLYHQAISELGFSAFSCYAHDLWVSVEGAEVLGLEFLMQIAFEQISEEKLISGKFEPAKVENVIVQVGGGGLAHGVINALHTAVKLGILQKLPRVFLAQTQSCYPLAESYFAMLRLIMIESKIGSEDELRLVDNNGPVELLSHHAEKISKIAALVAANFESRSVQSALKTIAAHRRDFFCPWNANEPHSVAEGILDDTTYDGFEIARAMIQTGGVPVILTEELLCNAWDIGTRCTKLNISATGTAGLAALQSLFVNKIIAAQQETAIIFTGVETRKAPSEVKTENVLEVSANNHPIQAITKFFHIE